MAALAYPVGLPSPSLRARSKDLRAQGRGTHLRLVTELDYTTRLVLADAIEAQPGALRSLEIPGGKAAPVAANVRRVLGPVRSVVAIAAMFVVIWIGAGALSNARTSSPGDLVGSHSKLAGSVYTVRPGDTVWAIATALNPSADPRPAVDQLEAELQGRQLQAGMLLRLP